MLEFYGPEYSVFKSQTPNESLKTLLDNAEPLKKAAILKHMRETIDSVLEKSTFALGNVPILHKVIHDYLLYADASTTKDLIELLKDHLVHILHTREGSQIASYCILHAGPKGIF
jgi:pumilio family protein 6